MNKKVKALAIIAIIIGIVSIISPERAVAAQWPTYTYAQVNSGVLGNVPTINSIVDEDYGRDQTDFLSIKEMSADADYSTADRRITSEKKFWLHVAVTNNNRSPLAVAKGTRVSFHFTKKYAGSVTVKATIRSSNATPSVCSDSIELSSNKKFRLKYIDDSAALFNSANDYGGEYTIDLPDSIVTQEGALIGSEDCDGVIEPGESVTLAIGVKVIYPGDIIESFDDLNNRKIAKYMSLKGVRKGTATYSTGKAWNLVQRYSNPRAILNRMKTYTVYKGGRWVTAKEKKDKKYAFLKKQAKKIIKGKKGDYEKIFAVASATAKRVRYDYPYYYGKKRSTYMAPYDVWKKRKSVCQGYAQLNEALLNSVGIPTMVIHGYDHAYNAAYSYQKKRWVLFDSTWMRTDDGLALDRFDIPPRLLAQIGYHQIYNIEGIKRGNTLYTIVAGKNTVSTDGFNGKFTKPSSWFITPSAQYKKSAILRIHGSVAGYKVKKIQKYAFFNKRHIRKVYIPKTVRKVGNNAFYVDWKGHRLGTKVVTKLSKGKLNLRNGWGNRSVQVI